MEMNIYSQVLSIDTVGDSDSQIMFLTEYLNSLNLSGLPKHELTLKKCYCYFITKYRYQS